jgi:dihydrofolate reductase
MWRGREGEIRLIKNNVLRDKDVIGGEIKTPVTFVVSGVSEENASSGPRCQFVDDFDGEIRIAGTTEHAQVLIGGGNSMEGEVWAGRADRLSGEVVQQIFGGVQPFYPVASRSKSLKKQGAQHIINGADDALGFTVLRRSVGARHP